MLCRMSSSGIEHALGDAVLGRPVAVDQREGEREHVGDQAAREREERVARQRQRREVDLDLVAAAARSTPPPRGARRSPRPPGPTRMSRSTQRSWRERWRNAVASPHARRRRWSIMPAYSSAACGGARPGFRLRRGPAAQGSTMPGRPRRARARAARRSARAAGSPCAIDTTIETRDESPPQPDRSAVQRAAEPQAHGQADRPSSRRGSRSSACACRPCRAAARSTRTAGRRTPGTRPAIGISAAASAIVGSVVGVARARSARAPARTSSALSTMKPTPHASDGDGHAPGAVAVARADRAPDQHRARDADPERHHVRERGDVDARSGARPWARRPDCP